MDHSTSDESLSEAGQREDLWDNMQAILEDPHYTNVLQWMPTVTGTGFGSVKISQQLNTPWDKVAIANPVKLNIIRRAIEAYKQAEADWQRSRRRSVR